MNQSKWEEDLGSQNLRVALIRIIKGIGSLQAQLGSQGHTLSRLEAKKAGAAQRVEATEPPKLQVPIRWLILGMLVASTTGGLLSWALIRLAPPSELGRINGRVNNLEIRMQRLEKQISQQTRQELKKP